VIEIEEEISKQEKKRNPGGQGFASMSPERRHELAQKGAHTVHSLGIAHKWTPQEAQQASWKGLARRRQRGVTLVKAKVQEIFVLDNDSEQASSRDDFAGAGYYSREAAKILNALEEFGITLEQDGDEEEIWHILKDGKPWLVFHQGEWAWMSHQGRWPWERKKKGQEHEASDL
jgi:uncharacterized protein